MKLNDSDIRTALLTKLNNDFKDTDYRIVEEFSIRDGRARTDIAVINGRFHGFEIKSDQDTLLRLGNQITMYDETFEYCTIVVGKKHLERVLEILPFHWGVYVAYPYRNRVILKKIRRDRLNPNFTVEGLTDVLWNAELKKLLKDRAVSGYSRLNKFELQIAIQNHIPIKDLCLYTKDVLKTRENWRVTSE
ncbi:sce7726 family protein [Erysipelothrix rhusiopathiae]|nr:sce7726 family protein [Erysipelothrix rhusiopathiae]